MSEHGGIPREQRTTGTAIVEALAANGVQMVFGIPGTHNIEIYRGLAQTPSIQHVLARHEQGAAYAADGLARATGRPGVVVTTSGPGLTNALSGIANAYADSIPMLVISPGPPRGWERADAGLLHEVKDQRSAVQNIADRSIRPGSPRAAVEAIHDAFARWQVERPRPVHIEVPLDVLEQSWTDADGDPGTPWATPAAPAPSAESIAAVRALVAGADGPIVIIAGGGSVDAARDLTLLAERIDAVVVSTTLGKGVLDERHPLSVGEFATYPSIRPLFDAAGLIIAIGTELGNPSVFGGSVPLIRVDIAPSQVQKSVRADVAIVADASAFCRALIDGLPDRTSADARMLASTTREAVLAATLETTGQWRAIQDDLQAVLPDSVIITGDSSQVSYLGTGPHWRFRSPRHYIVTTGYSTLGYALPAAIGAKLGIPDAPVVCTVGDGALLFSIQELITLAELRLTIPVIVVDNHGFAEIRQNMAEAGMVPMAVEPGGLDLAGFAAAVRIPYVLVRSTRELAAATATALQSDGPTIVHFDMGIAKSLPLD